jgi:hypothetical protein
MLEGLSVSDLSAMDVADPPTLLKKQLKRWADRCVPG